MSPETQQTSTEFSGQARGRDCLLFTLNGARYGVDVERVFEILWLPELTPVAQTPYDVPGIFDLRGRIVTVLDLNQRLGYRAQRYRTDQRLIVFNDRREDEVGHEISQLTGLIVDHVQEVRRLAAEEISPAPDSGILPAGERASLYVAAVARAHSEAELLTILDEVNLLRYSEGLHERGLSADTADPAPWPAGELPVFCPEATPEEREVFIQRCDRYAKRGDRGESPADALLQIAVVSFGKELFAIHLGAVLEFGELKTLTRVPCTPEHIVGCMNLRGEVLTLVDIRGALNLPTSARARGNKVMLVRFGEVRLGVVLEDVLDILAVPHSELRAAPSAMHARGNDWNFIEGVLPCGDRFASLLDLERLIRQSGMLPD